MKKLFLTSFLLIVIVLVGTKACIALFGYQALEAAKNELQGRATLSFAWLSSSYDGELIIHDLNFTPFALKQSYQADSLTIDYGNVLDLILGLMELRAGGWRSIESFTFDNARTRLTGRGLIEWLSLEYDPAFRVPFNIYGCPPGRSLQERDWLAMGIKEWHGDLRLTLHEANQETRLRLNADLHEVGKLKMQLALDSTTLPQHIQDIERDQVAVHALNIQHTENGFVRRVSNFCSAANDIPATEFASRSSKLWSKAMIDIGVLPGASITETYENYLSLGGKLTLSFLPEKPVTLSDFKGLLDRSLTQALGFSIGINDQLIANPTLFLSGHYFNPPTPVIEEPIIVPRKKPRERQFLETDWETLTNHINQSIRVYSEAGKFNEGILIDLDENKLSVSQRVGNGDFTMHLKKMDIQRIEVWR